MSNTIVYTVKQGDGFLKIARFLFAASSRTYIQGLTSRNDIMKEAASKIEHYIKQTNKLFRLSPGQKLELPADPGVYMPRLASKVSNADTTVVPTGNAASTINNSGMLVHNKIIHKRFAGLEHGALNTVHAIVVHQTDTTSAEKALTGYESADNGAHFLIAKQGQIYQTASMQKRCWHVGKRIKSKCLTINMNTCNGEGMAQILAMAWGSSRIIALDVHERDKSYPNRYPVNSDSLGIELAGKHIDINTYEAVTSAQNLSLKWLVKELYNHFDLNSGDTYRHPTVSYKHVDEAGSAEWE